MITKIKNIKNTVFDVLRDEPETRDNDRLLMFKIWAIQNKELKRNDYSLWHFAQDFINGRYADPESIRRNRQMLQKQYESLQGSSYPYRQKLGVETQQQIKML